MKRVINGIYRIKKDNSKISLAVTIGYRQDADVEISLKDQKIHQGFGSVILELGNDNDLNLADLKVVANAQDIQSEFDLVTMTLTLKGGKTPKSWTVGTESIDGNVYYLKIGITFIN